MNTNKEREFEIKLENRQLSVIDKIYVNGGLFFELTLILSAPKYYLLFFPLQDGSRKKTIFARHIKTP